jgi:hypothetical protein
VDAATFKTWILLAIVLSFVPSIEVYGGYPSQLLEIRTPVEHHTGMVVYFLAILIPGLFVWRQPKLLTALSWSLVALGATFAMVVVTFDLGDWTHRLVELWPATLFGIASATLVVTLIAVVPVFCLGFALATYKRPPPRREFATARVIRRK